MGAHKEGICQKYQISVILAKSEELLYKTPHVSSPKFLHDLHPLVLHYFGAFVFILC